MNEGLRPSIAELLADRERVLDAIRRAVRDAVLQHARAGQPVAVSRNGEVVWIQPDEILKEFAG